MLHLLNNSRIMRLLVLILFALETVQSARILGVFYVPGYSHFVLGETIFKELARRGHEVTVISCSPQKEPLENYKDVPMISLMKEVEKMKEQGNVRNFVNQPAFVAIAQVFAIGTILSDMSLNDTSVQSFLHSNQTFDVIILEQFLNEAHFGFMHHFKAPVILMATTRSSLWTNTLMGNPTPYAYVPNLFLNFSPKMNLWERTWNTVVSIYQNILFHLWVLPTQEAIMHKYFPDAPPLRELMHKASLTFLNSHPIFGSAVPLLPNMIEIGGFHVEGQEQKNLTDDLKNYLDGAKEGVVYFSMGSNLQSKDLDIKKREIILNTLAKLKLKVLWKFEAELPGKPANVKIEKWLPQSAVLAHENVKLFITHGGKLSTIESIYYGKPILGMPMFAEQYSNVQEAVYLGYGRYVSFETITEETLTEAITEILDNPKYAKEARYRASALKNLKVSPLNNAISWIEYVIENKGAVHLRNEAVFLPLYKYLLLDVMLVFVITSWVAKKLIWILFSKICGKKTQKQKVN